MPVVDVLSVELTNLRITRDEMLVRGELSDGWRHGKDEYIEKSDGGDIGYCLWYWSIVAIDEAIANREKATKKRDRK